MKFEDIRPYYDSEVAEKIQKLIAEEQFQQVITHVAPNISFEAFKEKMLAVNSVKEFQLQIVLPLFEHLLQKSSEGVNFNGIEHLEKGKSYLFISTHRDIVLDSAVMNYILKQQGFETAEIAIGDNLMKVPWVVDLVKLNKTFIVKRDLPKEQKVQGSMQLSDYINHTIQEKKESIWIAQRSGRSKDGDDRTNPSLLKMFILTGKHETVLENIKALEICPVSISYEYNPCDALTLPELMTISRGEKYEKQPIEDMIHMGQGIEGKKGKIEVSFGKPINNSLDQFEGITNRNQLLASISKMIDNEIHATYKLMPTNYIAYDLLNESSQFIKEYSAHMKEQFVTYMHGKLAPIEGDESLKKDTFLRMYANPVYNKLALS